MKIRINYTYLLLFSLFSFFISPSYGQNIVEMTDGSTFTGCEGLFYPPNGTQNSYDEENSTTTFTICNPTAGAPIYLVFNMFELYYQKCGLLSTTKIKDKLKIYNGSSTSAPLIGEYTENQLIDEVVTGSSGCLTFEFERHESGTGSFCEDKRVRLGWQATIHCVQPDNPPKGGSCNDAKPFCSDQSYYFPNTTSGSAPNGPNYGCLGSQPAPIWYYLKIGESGTLQLHLEQEGNGGLLGGILGGGSAGIDIDFAMWGPFDNIPDGCAQIMSGNLAPLQCSYSPAPTETIGIGLPGGYSGGSSTPPPAVEGEYYILLLTNFEEEPGHITLEQTSGTGSTDCSILSPCIMTDITTNIGSCDANGKYTVSGEIEFSYAPEDGHLIVEDCNGNSISLDPPFNSPMSYSLNGLDGNGQTCNITAYFEKASECSIISDNYTAPNCDSDCTAPTLIINPLSGCNNIDLNDAIDPSSDQANISFYASQNDANTGTNPINNEVTQNGSYWVRGEHPTDGCYNVYEITVTTTTINYTADITNADCGEDNGKITLTANGGEAPYSYSIDNGANFQSNNEFDNLAQGNYDILIKDANGCEATGDEEIVSGDADNSPNFDFEDFCLGETNGPTNITSPGGTFAFNPAATDGATIDATTGVISNAVAGATYSVEYTTNGSCASSKTVNVKVNTIAFTTTITDAACGESDGEIVVTISNSSTGTDYSYSIDGAAQNDNTFDELAAGSYNIVVTDENGCSASSTENISNIGGVSITDFDSVDPSCKDACDGTASITITGGTSPFSYSWKDENGNSVGGNNDNVSSLCGGVYIVTVIDNSQCQASETITLTDPEEVPFELATQDPTCGNDDGAITISNLSANTTYTVNYRHNGSTVTVNITTDGNGNVLLDNLAEGTYSNWAIEENGGCTISQSDIVVLSEPGAPTVIAPDNVVICLGESVMLTAQNPDGANISWDNGIVDGVSFTPTSDGEFIYVVTATQDNCSSSDDVMVTVIPTPTVDFSADDRKGCEPFEVSFDYLSDAYPGSTCTWDLGDGNIKTGCGNITHTYMEHGSYDVTLTIETPNGCAATETKHDYINIISRPVADFTASPMITTVFDTEVTFTNKSKNANQYIWDFGDNSPLVNDENTMHTYNDEEEGKYTVTLIAQYDDESCSDTTRMVIIVYEELIYYVPNAFTPDNDNFNEVFLPIFSSGYDPQEYTLTIYNRWGEILFESHDINVGWNGTYGGKIVQDGTYVWKIRFKETWADKHSIRTGHVTIIR